MRYVGGVAHAQSRMEMLDVWFAAPYEGGLSRLGMLDVWVVRPYAGAVSLTEGGFRGDDDWADCDVMRTAELGPGTATDTVKWHP